MSDVVVLGPGSLFTSILPNLVIEEIGQALLDTKASSGLCLQYHDPTRRNRAFSDSDPSKSCTVILGRKFVDTVLVNIEPVPHEYGR